MNENRTQEIIAMMTGDQYKASLDDGRARRHYDLDAAKRKALDAAGLTEDDVDN